MVGTKGGHKGEQHHGVGHHPRQPRLRDTPEDPPMITLCVCGQEESLVHPKGLPNTEVKHLVRNHLSHACRAQHPKVFLPPFPFLSWSL